MTIDNAQHYKGQVKTLLEAEKLPVTDLSENLDNFFVAIADTNVIGVAGVEIYGNYGLLRSVAVQPGHRSSGVGGELLGRIESLSAAKGIAALYLLTETAQAYFKNKGFTQISRGEVPEEIKGSSEFSHVCPASAIVMKKSIS